MKISPEEVKELYELWNKKPAKCIFNNHGDKTCPLGILFLNANDGELDKYGYFVVAWAHREYGNSFVEGFYPAFDIECTINSKNIWRNDEEKEGWLNGIKVREYLKQFYTF